MPRSRCQFCGKTFETLRAVNHHISASESCYNEWRKDLLRNDEPSPKRPKKNPTAQEEEDLEGDEGILDVESELVDDFVFASPPGRTAVEIPQDDGRDTYPTSTIPRFIEPYPGDAGQGIRKCKTRFEKWFKNQSDPKNPWDPFASKDEWSLTMWLLKNVGQKATDQFLKLPIVSDNYRRFLKIVELTVLYQNNSKEKLSFYNSYSFLKKVDKLPIGPEWKCNIIEITGDRLDDDGNPMNKQVELWYRDPIECVKELLGNPAFDEFMSYVQERVFMDGEGKERIFNEMWTGNWWWNTQV